MPESILHRVRVVLYEPQNTINIAATVRAMKNFGVQDLVLVRPVPYTAYRLEGIAHDTLDIIDRAYILHEGRVLTEGAPGEIIAHEGVRRVYLGDRFSL